MWKQNCWVKALCAGLCLLLLVGCSRSAPLPAVTETVTVVDALGREVTVGRKPARVAALIGSFAEVWQLAGGTICAAPEDAWDDFGLELGDAVNIGGAHSPNTELVLAAHPELVLASASTAADVAMKETLEAAGITVLYFDVDNFEEYLAMLKICTDITGRADLYEQNGVRVQTEIERIKAAFSASDAPRTVLLLRASSGSVKAKGSRGTVLGEMLSDLGCVNIADSDTTLLENLSVEAVLRRNPYRIFAVTMGDETAAAENVSQMMEEDPAWASLEAVKNGRLHVMDRRLFNLKPNARWAEAYETLCDLLCA